MKIEKNLILYFILFPLCQLWGQDHTGYKDFQQDSLFPAFNQEMTFPIHGDTIAAYAFIANGSGPKETILLLHGYPGYDNNFDLAHVLRRTGKNVIHFNYRGAWGNQGNYLYSSGLADVDGVIQYLSTREIAEKLKIDTSNFILLGRSYGGGIALIKGSLHTQVKKIIAISSVNYGDIMEGYQTLNDLQGFKKYMVKQIMINTDIDAFLQEMLDKKTEFNVLTYQQALKNKKVLLIEDSNKNQNWISQLENIHLINIPSGHGFIDKRIEMIDTIIAWLKDN